MGFELACNRAQTIEGEVFLEASTEHSIELESRDLHKLLR